MLSQDGPDLQQQLEMANDRAQQAEEARAKAEAKLAEQDAHGSHSSQVCLTWLKLSMLTIKHLQHVQLVVDEVHVL